MTLKLASLLSLTNQDDDNNDEHEDEVDHSELETLLQQWLDDDQKEDNNADDDCEDSQDGLELQEVEAVKVETDDAAEANLEPTDLDALLECLEQIQQQWLDDDTTEATNQTNEDEGRLVCYGDQYALQQKEFDTNRDIEVQDDEPSVTGALLHQS